MKINRVIAVYFSPTGATKKVTEEIARSAAHELAVPFPVYDLTLPAGLLWRSMLFQRVWLQAVLTLRIWR